MSVVKALDDLTSWVQENICEKIKLKAPAGDYSEAEGAGYKYNLVTPTAFTLFVPTKDRLPPKIVAPIPSVCVRFREGSESLTGQGSNIGVQLLFSTWSGGNHGADIFFPNGDGSFKQNTGPEADNYYVRTGDGWRDAWNVVDIALRELSSVTTIKGMEIDRTADLRFGPLAEQEDIPDYYPFWFCWVEFSVKQQPNRNNEDLKKYL